jgi:ADP-heptose:LPS heptosyltransferase
VSAPPSSVAVLRALQLGDLLCAVPALRAMRAAWPRARVVLVGLPWARAFATRFAAYVDEFEEFPGFPGLPERASEPQRIAEFAARMRERDFDLAIQLHGSGEQSNRALALLGARRMAGFHRGGVAPPSGGTFLEWRDEEHETERGLRLLAALGVPHRGAALELPLGREDRCEAVRLAREHGFANAPYACVHPGAQLASRRWAAERFAAVGDALAARGLRVVVTGTAPERELARRVVAAMATPAIDLAGLTTLGGLGALVDEARIVVSNDTGVRHVAAARGTPCVAVACGSDVRRWGARGTRERVLHADVPCRPCVHADCPVAGHPCARLVAGEAVIAAVTDLLAAKPKPLEPRPCAA